MAGSYLVLARKYRPKTFDEVVGQEVAKRVLRGAIAEGRVGHAYLLSGPRGTGKTTLARIVARSLNCEAGPTPEPCGTCERCVGLDAGREADVVEIDAASHTGVDSIRDLRDEVAYAPLRARTKVYIVDEVHMLSKAAFNALLKTLEEPPPHVVFLFATTEPHKVLGTILSRCQVLRLEPLPVPEILGRLEEVFAAEGIQAEDGVLEEIARGARGGMRDALSKADELLALGGSTPTLEDLRRLGAGAGSAAVIALLDALEAGDKPAVLARLAEVPGTPNERLGRLLGELRRAVLVGHLGVEAPQVEGTPEEREGAMARARRLGLRRLELMMQELLAARERARLLPGEEAIVLEVCLLELADPDATIPLVELAERLEALAGGAPVDVRPARREDPRAEARSASQRSSPDPAPIPAAAAPRAGSPAGSPVGRRAGGPMDWLKAAIAGLREKSASLADLLEGRGRLDVQGTSGRLVLQGLDATENALAADARNRRRIVAAVTEASGLASVEIDVASGGKPAPLRPIEPPTAEGTGSPTPKGKAGRERAAGPGEAAPAAPRVESSAPPPPPRRAPDDLTRQVAGLFEGVVEDLERGDTNT